MGKVFSEDRALGISIGRHVKQYKDIAMLLAKYGNSDLFKDAGFDEV
jgi:hypothetical protein